MILYTVYQVRSLEIEGWKYVHGGASPTTSLIVATDTTDVWKSWNQLLPRTAQQQHDVTRIS